MSIRVIRGKLNASEYLFLPYTTSIMKANHYFKLILLFIYTISCAGKGRSANATAGDIDSSIILKTQPNDHFETGKIISPVVCKANPTQSYALYIPAKTANQLLPVIYFFDPHGDGVIPLHQYKTLADRYHFILIGSNNSKNGNEWNDAENIWGILSSDSQERIPMDKNRIYLCGFSGGAKVATYIALHHPEIKGVIANGAGLSDITQAGNFNFSFTAIAGEGDMNMTDLVSINSALDKTQGVHRIIFFDGIHEWAPESTMNKAFAGFQFDAMRQKIIPQNDSLINNFIAENKKEIGDDVSADNYIKAEEACKLSISMLNGLTTEINWFNEKENSLTNNPVYQKQFQERQDLLVKEENIKAGYEQQFQNADMNYWIKTINDDALKAKAKTPEGNMYKRLQAYLSLAFYSISNQFINGNQNKDAEHFVTLYKMADPTNNEAWYLSAVLDARNNNATATKNDLLKSISLGFNDKKRLEQQSEFQTFFTGGQVNLSEMEGKMK